MRIKAEQTIALKLEAHSLKEARARFNAKAKELKLDFDAAKVSRLIGPVKKIK